MKKSYRILVVDDNEPSAKTLGWMMELLGHEVRIALRGKQAIAEARMFFPQVVLLDIGLPDINGYEVCEALRKDPATKNAIIIAQTGWGQNEHKQLSKEAGFDSHLVKPIDMQAFEELLASRKQSEQIEAAGSLKCY